MKLIQPIRLTPFYNKRDEWYFVKLEDAEVSNTEADVLKKAYSNVYAVMDVSYTVKEKNIEYPPSDYGSPIQFFRTHTAYILVFRRALNPYHAMQLKNHRLKHEHHPPEFTRRLEGYIYKEAYAVTEDVSEHTFLRDFASQCYLAYLRRGYQCVSESHSLPVFSDR